MRRLTPLLLPLLFACAAAAQDAPAPSLAFRADTVLRGGHVLRSAVTLPATSGPVTLLAEDGKLNWTIVVEHGETRLLDDSGHWAAKAEYHRFIRSGLPVCQIYQTTISPEWVVLGTDKASRADYSPADDRIYSFRDAPCP